MKKTFLPHDVQKHHHVLIHILILDIKISEQRQNECVINQTATHLHLFACTHPQFVPVSGEMATPGYSSGY